MKLPWIITLIIQNTLLSFGGFLKPTSFHWPGLSERLSLSIEYDDENDDNLMGEQSSLKKGFFSFCYPRWINSHEKEVVCV